MLRNFALGDVDPEVVVLDFDLSWHVGALEKSVYVSGASAYLAPEQLAATEGATTRSAAVDAFGFGMTAFFMATRDEPTINAHQKSDWEEQLELLGHQDHYKQWRSVTRRFFRLVYSATRHNQSDRISFAEIVAEFDMLLSCIRNDESVRNPRILAEEVFARSTSTTDYRIVNGWPVCDRPSGLRIDARQDPRGKGFSLEFSFVRKGHESHQRKSVLIDYFKAIKDRISGKLVTSFDCRIGSGDYAAQIGVDCSDTQLLLNQLPKDIQAVADAFIAKLGA
jgi:hypothetical protein